MMTALIAITFDLCIVHNRIHTTHIVIIMVINWPQNTNNNGMCYSNAQIKVYYGLHTIKVPVQTASTYSTVPTHSMYVRIH